MTTIQKEHLLVTKGKEMYGKNEKFKPTANDVDADALILDIKHQPHAFVLACLMDRQIPAERAWIIPHLIRQELNTFAINDLAKVSEAQYQKIFAEKRLHHYNKIMALIFYQGVHHIVEKYKGNAALIWQGNPSSATVISRFYEFHGCGIKIATMAANILLRHFCVTYRECCAIDVSPDVQVMRVLKRMGLIEKEERILAMLKARELNPAFPGIIDPVCWQIGRDYCFASDPKCKECPVYSDCKKVIEYL
jgi:endonuclease III